MDSGRLLLAVLLPLTFSTFNTGESKKPVVKTIGKEADVTPLCRNETQNIILFVVCKISPEMKKSDECTLLYHHLRGFEDTCDFRFTLLWINQTVFLQLSNLKPEDSGTYGCECTRPDGIHTLNLNVTVQDNEDHNHTTHPPLLYALSGLAILPVFIITGVVLRVIYRNVCYRRRVPITIHQNMAFTDIEPYSVSLYKNRMSFI